ncbi:Uncharacterised protein [Citrobacter koseri]|nr:Uncharacterised protein [Citrobacter koseri]
MVDNLRNNQLSDRRARPRKKPKNDAKTIHSAETNRVLEQADQKDAAVCIPLLVVDQVLNNTKPGAAIEKRES